MSVGQYSVVFGQTYGVKAKGAAVKVGLGLDLLGCDEFVAPIAGAVRPSSDKLFGGQLSRNGKGA